MKRSDQGALDVRLDQDLLIEASAGTGKTYALTTLAARLIVEERLRIERLLIVTFTVAATGELRSRIWRTLRRSLGEVQGAQGKRGTASAAAHSQARDLVQRWRGASIAETDIERRLKRALRDYDRATITTIHGFCQRALRDFALYSGTPFEFAVSGDDMLEVGAAVRDFWRRSMAGEPIPLLEFAADTKFAPIAKNPGDPDVVAWTMENHPIPKKLIGAPGEPERTRGEETAAQPESAEPAVEEPLDRAFRAARAAWHNGENRSAFDTLKADGGWRKTKGKPQRDDEAMRAVETALGRNEASALSLTQAAWFSRSNLTKKRLQSHPPPETELWDRLEDLGEAGAVWLAGKRRDLLAEVRGSLQHTCWDDRRLSFNALLVELHRVLARTDGGALAQRIRERFPVALIDEFQDTDRLQARIFRSIYAPETTDADHRSLTAPETSNDVRSAGRLFIVGDPKQSIYRFRGADVFAYIEARERTSSAEDLKLARNYRSTPELIDATNRLFRRPNPFLLGAIPFTPAESPPNHDPGELRLKAPINETPRTEEAAFAHPAALQFRFFPGNREGESRNQKPAEAQAARQAAFEIAGLLKLAREGGATITRDGRPKRLEAGDIAVLVRTGAQGKLIAEALGKFGARSVEMGTDSVFESAEAKSLRRLLDGLCADESEFDAAARLRGALADDLFGLEMTGIQDLRDDDDTWETWSSRAREWGELWRERGIATLVRQVLFARPDDTAACASNLLRYPNGQRRLTNFLHLTDLLHEAETRGRLSRRRLLDWLIRSMTEVTKGETAQLRLESDEDLVKVVTVHRAKGLEFPIVFCPFVWHGMKKRRSSTASYYEPAAKGPVLDLQPEEEARKRQWLEEYADELRLLYVALTRARYRCVVTWSKAYTSGRSAFAWLLGGIAGDGDDGRSRNRGQEAPAVRVAADTWDAVEANTKRVQSLDAESAHVALTALAGGMAHIQTVREAPAFPDTVESGIPAREPDTQDGTDQKAGDALSFERPLRAIRQRTSYSALSTAAGAAHTQTEHDQVEEPDHDADDRPAAEEDEAGEPSPAEPTEPNVFTLPRGSRTGRWLHAIFERSLAPNADPDAVCAEVLKRYHVPEKWLDVTRRLVADTLGARLEPPLEGAAPFRIRNVERPVTEMEFHLPVCGMNRDSLRQCLLDHGYRTALPATDERIEGYLHGFIDLVARAGERWYVVDYKSNWLGPDSAAYRGEQLDAAMREHGYHLQYLLYLAALDRHLRLRLSGYDYDRHMGGAFYLFVRGMRPALPGNGVFSRRPSRAVIDALNACLGEGAA